jgi:hypothetical protein
MELVHLGEQDLVLDWCTDLAAGEPDFAPFAEQVRRLASAPDLDRLRDWLSRRCGPLRGCRARPGSLRVCVCDWLDLNRLKPAAPHPSERRPSAIEP